MRKMQKKARCFVVLGLMMVLVINMFTIEAGAFGYSGTNTQLGTNLGHLTAKMTDNTSNGLHMIDNSINPVQSLQIEPRYYACPGGGKHHMEGRGRGFAYRGSYPSNDLVISGFCSQCTQCGDFIIAENNPYYYWTTNLGAYAYGNSQGALSNVGTYFYTNDFYYNASLAEDIFFRSFVWYT